MKIHTICTFADWVAFYGSWGEPGIEKIFDYLKVAGIERVYWRALDGGLAQYPSKVAPRFVGINFTDQIRKGDGGGPLSYRSMKPIQNDDWDALATAVRIGHERKIEVCSWLTVYEEDHGGNAGSSLAARKDRCQQDRAGRPHPGAIELFYKDVQDYKLAIVRELLERGVDGIMLDFARHNATPSAGPDGIHRFGYNPEIRAAFRREDGRDPLEIAGDDPAWLAFKNRYQTDFVREIRRVIGGGKRMDLMVWPVDNSRWLCLDVPALTREGRVDLLASFSMSYSFSPKEMRFQYRSMKSQVRGSHTEIAVGIQSYWGIDPEEFEEAVHAVEKAGGKNVMLYEANHLVGSRLTTSVRAFHLQAPRGRREVRVSSLSHAPTEQDWKRARKYRGFFILKGPDRVLPAAESEFYVLKSPRGLHCRLVAEGEQGKTDMEAVYSGGVRSSDDHILKGKQVFIDALGARMYWLGADRGHLLLDVGRTRRKFTHFVIGLNGDLLQETNADNSWKLAWQGAATRLGSQKWMAEWTVPFKTLGATPKKGDRWGFQVIREQAATHEVSGWFVSTTDSCDGLRSHEWGDLVFL